MATPVVTGLNPATGTVGTSVTVGGSGFTGTTGVSFGSVAAPGFTVNSDTEIVVQAPQANVSGALDVTVTNPDGTSSTSSADLFTYDTTIPAVTAINPASGGEGTTVTVTGTGFTGATSVNFGGAVGTALSVTSDSQLTVTAPAPTASGSVDVTVLGPTGTSSATASDQFTYNHCCITTFNVPTARSGCTTAPASGGRNKMGERFNMEIDFDSSGTGCVCSCGEYRQFIRGTFTANGKTVVLLLPNPAGGPPLKLLPRPAAGAPSDNFQEDGLVAPPAGVNIHYGHRSEGSTDPTDVYQQPDRATGCQYRGNDFPGLTSVAGTNVTIDLDFRGCAIDTCNANASMQQNEWTVTCSGTL